MPVLNVVLSTRPDAGRSAEIAATLARLTAEILHKDAALTSIAVSHVEPAHWFVGGTPLAGLSKASFFLDILVTDETNTAKEKGAYIAAVFKAMVSWMGDLHDVSYVHVHDARAAAWGYGGVTQQFRAVNNAK